ncbi:MAG: M42 family metallopeptidase [Chloroflexi bacterium]|nr:M42 family metallopeptidase [Chloroflexota bacterium]
MKEMIKRLVEAYGPSGHESTIGAIISEMVRPHVDELHTDALGNIIALKRGTGSGHAIMVASHMDEIGLVVTWVDEKGFLRFAATGGVSPVTLVGGRVRFANGTLGVIGWERWMRPDAGTRRPEMDELYIDVGATSRETCPVGVGDACGFVRPYEEFGTRLVAKSMDDRIACAIAIEVLAGIGSSPHDLYFVFTTQEEVGTRGALTAAYGIEPTVGIALDVTMVGDTPKARPMAVSLGEGPAIKVMDSGMLAHPGVVRWMITTAEAAGIPCQREVLLGGSTDARAIQTSRAGVPAGCISIPCRYVHTPSEMVDFGDVEHSVALLKALLTGPIAL